MTLKYPLALDSRWWQKTRRRGRIKLNCSTMIQILICWPLQRWTPSLLNKYLISQFCDVEYSNIYQVWLRSSHAARATQLYCHCYLSRCRIQLYVGLMVSSIYPIDCFFSQISISSFLLQSGNDTDHRKLHRLSHQCTRSRRPSESLTNGV